MESTASAGYPADWGLPQSDLFAKGRCHETEFIAANKSKYQRAAGWKKTSLIDGFIMGIAVS